MMRVPRLGSVRTALLDLLVLVSVGGALLLGVVRSGNASPTPWYYPDDGSALAADSDGDGVSDGSDRCPRLPGTAACGGCPVELCSNVSQYSWGGWLGLDYDGGCCCYGQPISFKVLTKTCSFTAEGHAAVTAPVVGELKGSMGWSVPNNFVDATLRRMDGTPVYVFPRLTTSCGMVSAQVEISAQEFNAITSAGGFKLELTYYLSCPWRWDCGYQFEPFSFLLSWSGTGVPPPASDWDGDGVPIEQDLCPVTSGGPGCPDGCPHNACGLCGVVGVGDPDGDGILQCLDSDGDGVRDIDDRCPQVPGSMDCGGCPPDVCRANSRGVSIARDLYTGPWAPAPYGSSVWIARPISAVASVGRLPSGEPLGPVVATLESYLGYYAGEALSGSIVAADGQLVALFPQLDLSGCDRDVLAVVLGCEDFHRLQAGNWTIAIDGFAAPYGCGSETAMRLDYEVSNGVPPAGSDLDLDGVPIERDNCPHLPNDSQRDCDGDGIGNVCAIAWGAMDLDGAGVPDVCQYRAGDFDLDGIVSTADVGMLLLLFGDAGVSDGDLDGNSVVDTADLALLLLNFGPLDM